MLISTLIYFREQVYLDDQQSGWTVVGNHFTDCHVCSFVGGGRSNVIAGNHFVRCGTVLYLNDQGLTDPSLNGIGMINCSEVAAPFHTSCSTGAATWMTTRAPAAAAWRQRWPSMTRIPSNYPGYPAHNLIENNTYCRNMSAAVHELVSSNVDPSCPNVGAGCAAVLQEWQITLRDNVEMHDC
jgi:hypothetical protein|eukprot:COSAG02_NODE_364_length_23758_cov_17.250011_2_plen_183_part_00